MKIAIVKTAIVALIGCAIAAPVLAQEPAGCDKFKWPIEKERSLLTGKDIAKIASGSAVGTALPAAATVTLVPFAEAKLPAPPERAPRLPSSYAGFVQAPAPGHEGVYRISLTAEGWIDVVQGGHSLKSQGFSGATGCEGIRKSVKFELKAEPFTVEFTNVAGGTIGVAITGD